MPARLRKVAMRLSLFVAALMLAAGSSSASAGWTGCHVGGNLGYGSNDSKFTSLTAPANLRGVDAKSPSAAGGQVGCDLGVPFFVVGLGASYDFLEPTKANVRSDHIGAFPITVDRTLTTRTTLQNIAAVTGRAGFDVGPLLIYARAGGAMAPARMHYNYTIVTSMMGTTTTDLSATKSMRGLVYGGGAELRLPQSVSLHVEYLRYDFDACNCLFSGVYKHPLVGTMQVNRTLKIEPKLSMLRAGLAYHF